MQPSLRACDSSTNSKSEAIDGLENYDILREIGRGSTSTVRLAISKKGRLKGRVVAVKEIILSPATDCTLYASPSIHQALHHPSVVSCFFAYSTPSVSYHVLEYCANGDLRHFLLSRKSPVLSEESEVRGVLKNLVDALVYLEKELIVHRDVVPSNVLVTEDYRVKLAGFDLALRLSSGSSITTEVFDGNPDFISPEAASKLPYSYSTDLWSLGCLILTCLTGKPPFEADSVQKTLTRLKNARYEVPDTISFELRNVISGFLQIVPEQRTPLNRILSHPFFHPALLIRSLDPSQPSDKLSMGAKSSQNQHTDRFSRSHNNSKNDDPVYENGKTSVTLKPLGDLSNLSRRVQGEGRMSHQVPSKFYHGSTRRVASDPVTGTNAPKKFLDHERVKVRFRSRSLVETPPFVALQETVAGDDENETSFDDEVGQGLTQSGLLEELEEALRSPSGYPQSFTPKTAKNLVPFGSNRDTKDVLASDFSKDRKLPISQAQKSEDSRSLGPVPIVVTRPVPLNTFYLNPQTQKVNRGQLVILPSRSVLVDFREGDRRQGGPGSEVLLIDHDGSNVQIYSAPYLSSPCCLAEPTAIYSLDRLPSTYWKQYNDAGRILEQIKRHVPKLVMYDVGLKCTLMANEPEADIELLFHTFKHLKRDFGSKSGCQIPTMQIRLLRRRQLVEISRQMSSISATGQDNDPLESGEWTKKVLIAPGGDFSVVDQRTLEAEEMNGLARAIAFVSVCQATEKQTKESIATLDSPLQRYGTSHVDPFCPAEDIPATHASSFTSTLSHFNVAPRPPKFSSLEQAVHQYSADSLSTSYEGFETRFIPSVGWCVRYGSSGSAGKYKMMFFDGAILEVDVDGECVEFVDSVTEEVVRYNIRDCSSKRNLMERMKVFKEFVSLFDDNSESTDGL